MDNKISLSEMYKIFSTIESPSKNLIYELSCSIFVRYFTENLDGEKYFHNSLPLLELLTPTEESCITIIECLVDSWYENGAPENRLDKVFIV
eukprot:UN02648